MSVEPWQAAQALGSALKSNKSLLELNVVNNCIGAEGGQAFQVVCPVLRGVASSLFASAWLNKAEHWQMARTCAEKCSLLAWSCVTLADQ